MPVILRGRPSGKAAQPKHGISPPYVSSSQLHETLMAQLRNLKATLACKHQSQVLQSLAAEIPRALNSSIQDQDEAARQDHEMCCKGTGQGRDNHVRLHPSHTSTYHVTRRKLNSGQVALQEVKGPQPHYNAASPALTRNIFPNTVQLWKDALPCRYSFWLAPATTAVWQWWTEPRQLGPKSGNVPTWPQTSADDDC